MKNLFIKILILSGVALTNVAFANHISDSCLSVALDNDSSVAVSFNTVPSPYKAVLVQAHAPLISILPRKFMAVCNQSPNPIDNYCKVVIKGQNGSVKKTLLVPKGYIIAYSDFGIDISPQNIQCP